LVGCVTFVRKMGKHMHNLIENLSLTFISRQNALDYTKLRG